MRIQICTMLYEFQRRYWWQLSSLLQQQPYEGHPVPDIYADANISGRDQYYGWNDALQETFNRGVQSPASRRLDPVDELQFDFQHRQFKWPAVHPPEDDPYGRRSNQRSADIRRALASGDVDWLLFNDGDMVYHPQFFSRLAQLVAGGEEEHRVFAAPRRSMSFEDGYRLVDDQTYGSPVDNAWGTAMSVKTWPAARGRISGAGFFQFVSVAALRRLIDDDLGYVDYVAPGWDKDHNTFVQSHITRSDRKFRQRLGGIIPLPQCLDQLHINHYRKADPQWVKKGQH